jgi:uncharacterized protein DUF6883
MLKLLRNALMQATLEVEAIPTQGDVYGQRYVLDFELEGLTGKGLIRSTWIVRSNEDFPRMTSCYVL